jgi:hypothetical protein
LGAINIDDYGDFRDFNKKRNHIVHRHGQWWHSGDYVEALKKGIRFLENNSF